jgi:hypothetical protein
MGLIGCPETSVRNYHYLLRNNLEERSSRLFRGGCLKSSPRYFAVGVRRLIISVSIAITGWTVQESWFDSRHV